MINHCAYHCLYFLLKFMQHTTLSYWLTNKEDLIPETYLILYMVTFLMMTLLAKGRPRQGINVVTEAYWVGSSSGLTPLFSFILLTHEGSHREVYRDFQPSLTSSAGGAKG